MTTILPQTPGKQSRAFSRVALFLLCIVALTSAGVFLFRRMKPQARVALQEKVQLFPRRVVQNLARPPGMAPVAFDAYVRACMNAGVNPIRIGQTMGNDPRSVGYHLRDGIVTLNGQQIEYSAAVDIGVWGLSEPRIARFCSALAKQGFAAFYRRGGKWKGNEHIHAIYVMLPMKIQLRHQVRQFLRARRAAGLPPLRWERKLRRYSPYF